MKRDPIVIIIIIIVKDGEKTRRQKTYRWKDFGLHSSSVAISHRHESTRPSSFIKYRRRCRKESRVSRNKEQDYYKGIGTALFVFFPVRSKCAQSRVKRVLRALVFLLPLITFQPAGVNNNNNHFLAYRRGFLFSRSLIGSVFPFSMLSCRRVATTTACHRGIKRRSWANPKTSPVGTRGATIQKWREF